MKITIEKLFESISKKLYPIYLISGEETLLIEDAIDQIRDFFKQKYIDFERKSYHVNVHFDWQIIAESLNNMSLFSEKTLIELRLVSQKINETAQNILINYINKPIPNKTIIIITNKLDSNTQKTKWFKALDKAGIFIQVWTQTQKQLYYWIQKRLKSYQMSANANAIQLISEYAEGNPLAAKQEIEKLKLIFDKKHLTYEDVIEIIGDNTRYDIFSLNDEILSGNANKILHILNKLKEEGIEPVLILWNITKQIRILIEMIEQIKNDESIDTIFAKYKIWEKQKPLFNACIKRHDINSLFKLLKLGAHIDKIIKGVETGNVWNELKKISLGLTILSRV